MYVNSTKVTGHTLRDGDVVHFGACHIMMGFDGPRDIYKYKFHCGSQPAPASAQPQSSRLAATPAQAVRSPKRPRPSTSGQGTATAGSIDAIRRTTTSRRGGTAKRRRLPSASPTANAASSEGADVVLRSVMVDALAAAEKEKTKALAAMERTNAAALAAAKKRAKATLAKTRKELAEQHSRAIELAVADAVGPIEKERDSVSARLAAAEKAKAVAKASQAKAVAQAVADAKEEVAADLLQEAGCSICKHLLLDPVVLECSHGFWCVPHCVVLFSAGLCVVSHSCHVRCAPCQFGLYCWCLLVVVSALVPYLPHATFAAHAGRAACTANPRYAAGLPVLQVCAAGVFGGRGHGCIAGRFRGRGKACGSA